jgi:hypothetical protein
MKRTESDVEQTFVYPLFTNPPPNGLGFDQSQIKTKANIRRLTIDKGSSKKLYYPDYAIVVSGVPLLIVEAKAPGEDLDEAFREARLYATEINARYPAGTNPCARIVATDGDRLIAGYWDSLDLEVDIATASISALDAQCESLFVFASLQALQRACRDILKLAARGLDFHKPTSLLGGRAVADETVGENSFGANVSVEYKYLFNPESLSEREKVIRNAYVPSSRRMAHVEPIDRIIRAAIPPHVLDARTVNDLARPTEVTNQLRKSVIHHELCLLIGSVGSGKSTFTDYLRIEGLPADLSANTVWINLNLNQAPLFKEKIYDWVLDEIFSATRSKSSQIDFDELPFLRKVFAKQLVSLEKGRASLFDPESIQYKQAMFDELQRLQRDKLENVKSHLDFLFKKHGKQLIVIFDNCDKRGRDDQLLMFEVASWLKDRLACTIFLPLRDTTYDQYRAEPPLDTVIKDLVFRIDPPLLEKVIYSRLKYAVREISASQDAFVYHLSNGIRVECSRGDVAHYLKSIVASLFQDGFFRRIVTGLSGRNIRRGLEIVLDFCKSGHINEGDILKIRTSGGDHQLPNHLIARILLKGKRRYYSDEASNVKNLFRAESQDELPNPLVRLAILQWLRERRSEYGPNRTKGFHQAGDLIDELESLGFAGERVFSELQLLSNAECIGSESQGSMVERADLITILPAGYIHLELVQDVNYLSAIAEDTIFDSKADAKSVADNMVGRGIFPVDSRQAALSNASLLLNFLKRYGQTNLLGKVRLIEDVRSTHIDVLDAAQEKISRLRDNDSTYRNYEELIARHPPGTQEVGRVMSVQHYGFFVDFGTRGHGLIHKSKLNGLEGDIETGDWILVEVIKYDNDRRRFDLKLIDK